MKLVRNIHPGAYNLLSYLSQIPGAIYIAGTLPLDASLNELKEHFQFASGTRTKSGTSRCIHLCIRLTGREQTLTALGLGAITRQFVDAEGNSKSPWQAWLHSADVTPHIHVVMSSPHATCQGIARSNYLTGPTSSSGVPTQVLP